MDKSLAHSKWICKYHIIFTFTPKYRKKIIYNKVIIILRKANVRFNIQQAGPNFLIKLEKPRFVFFSVLGFYNVLTLHSIFQVFTDCPHADLHYKCY